MEENKVSKRRILKNISYILIPIFLVIFVVTIVSVIFIESNQDFKDAENFYETKWFSYEFFDDISRYTALLEKIDSNTDIAYDVQEDVDIGNNKGRIYYLTEYSDIDFLFVNPEQSIAVTNLEHTMNTDTIEEIKNQIKSSEVYWNIESGNVDTNINNLKIENIKYILPHQSNKKIMKSIANRLKIEEEKMYMNIENVGNTFCASIPIALSEMMKNRLIKKGDKIILLGYGGGLNTGSILLEV